MRIHDSRSIVLLAAVIAGCSSSPSAPGPGDAGSQTADGGGSVPDSGGTIAPDSGDDSGSSAGGCLGGGDVGGCTAIDPASVDGGAGACITGDFCTSIDGLNSDVEAAVLACEMQDTTAPTCSAIPSCVFGALARACPDPTTAASCAGIVSACAEAGVGDGGPSAVTLSSCEQILAGFNVTTRTVLLNCWSGSCDLGECVKDLFSPP
jgi:hypothetical protein